MLAERPSSESHAKADILLLLVTLLAATGWIFSKEALAGLPPLLFMGLRFFLAAIVLGIAGWHSLRHVAPAQLKQALGLGALFALAMAFWILGLFNASHVGEGAFITSMGIVLVPVAARALFGERPPVSTWVSLPVAVGGLACLSLNRGLSLEPGQLYFLIAAVFFALCFNLNTRLVRGIPAMALTSLQLFMVGVLLLPASMLFENWPSEVATSIWGWLLASALIGTCMRFFIQTYAQGLASASHAAIIMMLEPIWTALLASWWLGESMGALQLAGCGLIFMALLINRWAWVRRLLRRR
ncbi:MAG: EamA family transporter [Alteromonadaceae bacterium]|nr:EamA family transporter [Alteromonadaceae bacterium]|tara:strand:- start:530 stop:1426 length:897 start_codon:yes stop_codon:yes gene_type:complete